MPKQTLPHLLGSKWTAQQKTLGWRHFQVVNRKKQGKWVFAELVATCDPNVRFWLNAKTLKNRSLWASGWQTRSEINSPSDSQSDSQSDLQLDPQPLPSQIPSALYHLTNRD